MDIRTRAIETGDFASCAALLEGRLAYTPELVAALPRLWQALAREEALQAQVVELEDGAGGNRIVGFGCGVFVTDDWLAAIERATAPFVTERTLTADPSPILRPPRIGCENAADGLNVVNLHYAEAPGLGEEQTMSLRYQMMESFIECFSSFRVKAVVQEMWDEIAPEFIVHGWGSVRSEYAAYYARRDEAIPAPGRCPYLVGITRDEAHANPGDLAAALFVYTRPRLCFTKGEKTLLRQALIGRTDTDIANHLGVAMPTVKSRWRGIYQRVSARMPDLIPSADTSARGANRGQEKRRRLLEYLRRHAEELRAGIDERRTPG